jgi:Domain of unknown function (DUF4349)
MTKKRALVAITLVVVIGVVAAVFASGFRGGGAKDFDSNASADSGGSGAAEPAVADESGANALKSSDGSVARQASDITPMTRAVISTGQVTLHAKEMTRARAEIIRLVTSWGGSVADEQSTSDTKGRLVDSTMTLRVPSARFDDAMAAFDDLGDVEQRSRKSEDVSTKVIDNDARVRAAERSIRQIEALLSRAQKLGDIIAIESDLARRQADLDSLKSQQAWLEDQTSLSTINVYLSRRVVHRETHEAKGFLTGLENGWDALGGATVVALTAVGAVLPFAVLLSLLGVPLWWVVRRRRVAVPPPAQA